MNWREAKGEEEINIYQSERRRRTIHSLPKESRVSSSSKPHSAKFSLLLFFLYRRRCDVTKGTNESLAPLPKTV